MKPRRILIWLSIFVASGLLATQSRNPTLVAVVRSDGLLQLIARFDGKTWSALPSLPTWEDMPRISDRWFFCPTSDTTIRELMIGEPVHFERWDRQTTWAFLTDYCPRDVGSIFVPYPKAGFALDQQTNATQITTLDTLSQDWQQMRHQILSLFDKLEEQALSEDPAKHGWLTTSVPKKAEERRKFPNRLEYLSRTRLPMSNRHIYRFEVGRYYPAGAGCSLIAQLQGWAITNRNQILVVDQDFAFGDCDGKGLNATLRPLGVFESNNRIFLVIQGGGYEGEYHILSELVENRIATLMETK